MITTLCASVWTKCTLLLVIPHVQTRRSRMKTPANSRFSKLKITRSCTAARTKHNEHQQNALTKFARHGTNRKKKEFHTNKNITPHPQHFSPSNKTAPFRPPIAPKRSTCAHFGLSHRNPQPILKKLGEHLTTCILRLFPARQDRASRFSMMPPWWRTPYHLARTVTNHTAAPPFAARKLGHKNISPTIRQHAQMTHGDTVPTDHEWARKHENWVNGRVFLNHAPFFLNGFLTRPSLKKTLLTGISGEEGFFWPILYGFSLCSFFTLAIYSLA